MVERDAEDDPRSSDLTLRAMERLTELVEAGRYTPPREVADIMRKCVPRGGALLRSIEAEVEAIANLVCQDERPQVEAAIRSVVELLRRIER